MLAASAHNGTQFAFLIACWSFNTQDLPHQEEHIPDEDEEKTVPEYRNLIAIHAGKLKGSLENWLHIDSDKVRRLSLSEQELENAARTNGTDIVR